MNERRWVFAGLEFRILMERHGRDRLPFPLQFRPTVDSAADYHRQRHEANVRVTGIFDDDLRRAVHALIEPEYRIEIVGHSRSSGRAIATKLRSHTAVRHDAGVVLVQQPGCDDATGGDVTVTLAAHHRAPALALAALPSCRAGTHPRIDVPRPVGGSDAGVLRNATRTTGEEQFDRLLARPRSSAGEILVCPGSSIDGRPEDSMTGFHWVDIADDGRYVILQGQTASLLPAADRELENEVRRKITMASIA